MALPNTTMKSLFWRVFRDRQILIRSDQGVTHIRLRTGVQLAAAGVLAGLFLWGVASTTAYELARLRIADQADQIADLEIGYARLITDVANHQGAMAGIAGAGDGVARRVIARNETPEGRIAALRMALAQSEAARARAKEVEAALQARIDGYERDLAAAASHRAELERRNDDLAAAADELAGIRDGLVDERRRLQARIARLDRSLAEAETLNGRLDNHIDGLTAAVQDAFNTVDQLAAEREGLRAELAEARDGTRRAAERAGRLEELLLASREAAVDRWHERNGLMNRNAELKEQAEALENELAALRLSQEQLFAAMRERTDVHIAAVEKGLAFTGLDIDGLIEELRSDLMPGAGGPMIPPAAGDENAAGEAAVDLVSLVARAADLRDVVNRLPLAVPVQDKYRLSSGFGTRRDPFTGSRSSHEGLDFAARSKTPVYATAPGTVSFAGRNGAYGNMIEIDHGLGIVTRYAHLNRVDVELGQTVALGDQIGLLGSTGRSTGPHLHYEVLVDDTPRNPANFLKAGEHVFQIAEQ